MKKLVFLSIAFIGLWGCISSNVIAQGVGINPSGNAPKSSAGLDVDFNNKGMLIPRLTTAQRDAIINPAQALQIYNLTTKCFEVWENGLWQTVWCAGCPIPSGVTATAAAALCEGDDLTLTGSATSATGWSWAGPNGFSSSLQNPTILNVTSTATGVYSLTASNICGAATAVNTTQVTVSSMPMAPTLGTHIASQDEITWNWSSVSGATGYQWNTSNTYPGIGVNIIASPSYTQTNLSCNTAYSLYVWSYNACGNSASITLVQTTSACGPSCGTQIWAAANLNAGAQVPGGTFQTGNQKWCYDDDINNCNIYGGIYQRDNVMLGAASVTCDPCGPTTGHGGVQGMCPAGYHIPSDLEWSRYEYCVESSISPPGNTPLSTFQNTTGFRGSTTGNEGPGTKMKVTSSHNPLWNGTNASGFTALPGGWYSGGSLQLGATAAFLSATSTVHWLVSYTGEVYRDSRSNLEGFSVRCLKD